MTTPIRTTRRAASRRREAAKGFTLIEMLVAVIAVSLLTVGIVQVFRATTRTVAAGRKLSNILTYSNILERQLRDDIASMSRQGVLVIRNSEVGGIQTFRGDTRTRNRRIDELVFFAEGKFTTAREPVNPSVNAEAAAARIYYGHGLRQEPTTTTFQTPPSLTDDNSAAPFFGSGVNQFASDWILSRHVTLLAPARTSVAYIEDPNNPGTYIEPPNANLNDSAIQIGQQPAVPHIFRAVAEAIDIGGAQSIRDADLIGGQKPNFESGLVDIAACSIADIRTYLLSAIDPNNVPNRPAPLRGVPEATVGGDANRVNTVLQNVKDKLRDLFPADVSQNRRIRVEPAPLNPLGVGFSNPVDEAQREARRTDQRMLASHAFIPHCTSFIVEWSFGTSISATSAAASRVPAEQWNQLRWYGLSRSVTGPGGVATDVQPYLADYASGLPAALFFKTVKPVVSTDTPPRPLTVRYVPSPRLFEDNLANGAFSYFGLVDPTWPPEEMTADVPQLPDPSQPPPTPKDMVLTPGAEFFNFDFVDLTDPLSAADPEVAQRATVDSTQIRGNPSEYFGLARDVNFNGAYEPNIGERLNYPATLPWKWPRLLRITVTLADPIDPSFERTFQYVFDLPPDPTAERN